MNCPELFAQRVSFSQGQKAIIRTPSRPTDTLQGRGWRVDIVSSVMGSLLISDSETGIAVELWSSFVADSRGLATTVLSTRKPSKGVSMRYLGIHPNSDDLFKPNDHPACLRIVFASDIKLSWSRYTPVQTPYRISNAKITDGEHTAELVRSYSLRSCQWQVHAPSYVLRSVS